MPNIAVIGIPGKWSSEILADLIAERTGTRTLIDMSSVRFDSQARTIWWGDVDLAGFNAIVIKKISSVYAPEMVERLEMLRFLAGRGVRLFSDPARLIEVVDRVSCTLTLRLGGIPMPPTVITEDPAQALAAIERFGRAVLKPIYTSKARGMRVIEDGPRAAEEIDSFRAAGNPLMYIQRFVEHSGRDLGIVFLGDRHVGTYARVGSGSSWNTSTSSGGRYEAYSPTPVVIELAHKAQGLFGLEFASVDLVESADGPLVYEVSAFGGFRGLFESTKINSAALLTEYVLEKLSHA